MCFKGRLSSIVLIIRKRKSYFKSICVTAAWMSVFHKLTAVNLKSPILKASPMHTFYRIYKNFDEDNFNKDLKIKLYSLEKIDYSLLENTFIDVLSTHTHYKN